jgi:hypothetical protein
MRFFSIIGILLAFAMAIGLPQFIYAGITNPDLSAIGQVFGGYTDDPSSVDAQEPTLNLGEAEILLNASLNPYFKGALTLSASDEGVELEEAYTTMVKGLPGGLALKAGKYRLGFGKVNANHPHAYPFISPPRSLVSLLPGGDEGFNETGLQISSLLPTPGDWASTLSIDLIEAKSFHPDKDWTRLGWLGRWSNNFLLGEKGALETGFSAATGDDIDREWENAFIWGGDIKAKFYLPGASQLTLQAEVILHQGHAQDTSALIGIESEIRNENRAGFLALADYRFHTQFNGGFMYEQWENAEVMTLDRAFRAFLGYSVLEESTLLRIAYEHLLPEAGEPVNSIALQLLFSMGPHKVHQF